MKLESRQLDMELAELELPRLKVVKGIANSRRLYVCGADREFQKGRYSYYQKYLLPKWVLLK